MKRLIIAVSLAVALASGAALAQTTPPVSGGTGSTPPTGQGNGQNFQAAKAKILAGMQQRQACVQAANDPQAMKACFPDRGEHRGAGAPGAPE